MTGSRLAYAQLLRLPNVFTAFADILMAACAADYLLTDVVSLGALIVASGCLYCGGMVWNDYFDRIEDAKTRPFRPIPSGRVSPRSAIILGSGLFLIGLFAAALVPAARPFAVLLAVMILLYDSTLKHTPFGPLAMGTCRLLNVLLGLSPTVDLLAWPSLHVAAVIGVYIVGVTWFARTEEGRSNPRSLIAAAVVLLISLALAVGLPGHRPAGVVWVGYPYLLVIFAVVIGSKVVAAVAEPDPKPVQAAVKRCILGLVGLDAVLATTFVGPAGLLILLLLLPARWLGRRVYST